MDLCGFQPSDVAEGCDRAVHGRDISAPTYRGGSPGHEPGVPKVVMESILSFISSHPKHLEDGSLGLPVEMWG